MRHCSWPFAFLANVLTAFYDHDMCHLPKMGMIRMATPGAVTRLIADGFAVPHKTITKIDRALVEAGFRRTGGRGPGSMHFAPIEAARLLTAIAAAPVAGAFVKTAALACRNYFDLPLCRVECGDDAAPWFGGACPISQLAALPARHTFGEALTALIESAVAGELQTSLTTEIGSVIRSISPRAVEVEYWAPGPQCRIRVNLPGTDTHNALSEQLIYTDIPPDSIEFVDEWSEGLRLKYGNIGDLSQIRTFTVTTIIKVGELLRDKDS